MTICCIAYTDCSTLAEFLKELVFNKSVFGCLSPFNSEPKFLCKHQIELIFHKILLKTFRFNLVLTKSLREKKVRQHLDFERALTYEHCYR